MPNVNSQSDPRRSRIRSFLSHVPQRVTALKSRVVTTVKGFAAPRNSSPIRKSDHLKAVAEATPATAITAGEASSKVAGIRISQEIAPVLLPTASLGWRGLEEVKSRCSGRICLPEPGTDLRRRPSKLENDTALLEFDLFDALTSERFAAPLPSKVFKEMDEASLELLAALDALVCPERMMRGDQNQVLCELKLHNLNSLLCFLNSSDKPSKFTLIANPSTALFQLRADEIGATWNCLKKWKQISEQLLADLDFERSVPQQPQQPKGLALEGKEVNEIDKRASLMVSKMFDQFRQLDCARPGTHELRLRVSEELYAGPPKSSLDMFVSCCPNGTLFWHEAQCKSLDCEVEPSTTKKTLCEAIRRAIEKRQRLYLQVGPNGLFDITEEVQAEQLESDNFDGESLSEFLKRQAFTPIRLRDLLDNTAKGKVRYHEKVEMALVLSKCLVDFFDEDFELPWTPSHIHLKRASSNGASDKNRYGLYVSFRSVASEVKTLNLSTGLAAGNPMLLSFAKLLLEIESGEEIGVNIHPEPRLNMSALGKLIEYLDLRESETENPGYLRAVRGCLFAGTALQIPRGNAGQDSATRRLMRKELNEKIVMELERICKPQSRLVRDQPSGDVKSKKVGAQEALQLTDIPNTTVSLYDDQEEESKENRRRAKHYLDRLRHTFEPLRNCHPAMVPPSTRPVRVAIIDSGLDTTDPVVRARTKQIKGKRNWTSPNPDDCDDTYGHGTHVARLLVTVAPTSEIFVAKVSTGKQLDHKNTDRIAQAIDWAAAQWDVDIISLSLGLDTENEKIEKALNKVINPERGGSKKIVIAAAANWGGNQGIAFPGRHRGVICVHSTDGMGNPSETNPTPKRGASFATLGLSIESSVKKKEGKGRKEVIISGTSYATPIAAGIAANILEFASHQLHNRLSAGERENLFAYWGMSRLFERMSERRSEYDYILPWKLFDGREPRDIADNIHDILRGMD